MFNRLSAINYQQFPAPRGFTLIELLLAIGIFWVIAAGAATPILSTFLASRHVDTAAKKVVRTLRKAQGYALSGKKDSAWGVHYESDTLTLFKGTSFLGRDPAFDEETDVSRAVTVENLGEVHFGKLRGKPSTTFLGDDKVRVFTSHEERTISLNGEGRVFVQ